MRELNLADILENTTELKEKKVGYAAIVGRPNAGKSTFVNTLIGEKISITTDVPQTTRNKILAIYNDEDSQIVFMDTPGIHKSQKSFNEVINKQAIASLKDAEVVLYFIDSSREGGEEEKYIRSLLEFVTVPIIKIYTKCDLPAKINIPQHNNVFMISSVLKTGFQYLLAKIKSELKTGPTFFAEDYYTQQNMNFRISEIIREKVFLHTKEEIPHATFIGVDEIEDKPEILRIVAYVYAESDSQKYVLIGKQGTLITKIGKQARIELEKIFGKKVFLALRVKVKKNWRKDEKFTKNLLQ
ncbi:MAG: GTPase Era [Candidatus Gracilibacteria bacterium]|nr:GTPase Era [Candidatus Gracilibacteria bacterium]